MDWVEWRRQLSTLETNPPPSMHLLERSFGTVVLSDCFAV